MFYWHGLPIHCSSHELWSMRLAVHHRVICWGQLHYYCAVMVLKYWYHKWWEKTYRSSIPLLFKTGMGCQHFHSFFCSSNWVEMLLKLSTQVAAAVVAKAFHVKPWFSFLWADRFILFCVWMCQKFRDSALLLKADGRKPKSMPQVYWLIKGEFGETSTKQYFGFKMCVCK